MGLALLVFGIVVLLRGGVSYTKERESAQIGPIQVAAERKGFISPIVGGVAAVLGVVLVLADVRRRP